MEVLKDKFRDVEWTEDVSGLYHCIENEEAVEQLVSITKGVTLQFYHWVASLSDEDKGGDTLEELFRFFIEEVY